MVDKKELEAVSENADATADVSASGEAMDQEVIFSGIYYQIWF